jgi:predicted nuclease of restriction endonuclease-like (RecB) superfamily
VTTSRGKKSASKKVATVQAPLAPSSISTLTAAPEGYAEWLSDVKARIHGAQQRAAESVNAELFGLYWSLGRDILDRQSREGWGAKIVDRLAADLKAAMPETKGFSPRNLKYMRRFAQLWPEPAFVQQLLHKLPWFHLCTIIDKLGDAKERDWYVHAAIEHGWSRNVLAFQIQTRAHRRVGNAVTNFSHTLPTPESDLARESLKDPYRFDFLRLGDDALEREIELALVRHITQFLLELGTGFAFVGRQKLLTVGGDEFFIDLVFYHLKLRRYVVIELKGRKFQPGDVGQLGFYLAAIDGQVKGPDDGPTIGLLLCKTKNEVVAEYALSGMKSPMGVAEYQLIESLPKDLEANLPSVERIEEELNRLPTPKAPRTAKKPGKQVRR